MLGFEKDDVDLPPSYDSTLQNTLAASSHGVTLSIPTPKSGHFVPGDHLDARLTISNDVLNSLEGDVRCTLEGKSSVEVMGKQRYQTAQLVSASLGSNPMPIVGRDEHLFASQSSSIPKPESFGGDTDLPINLTVPQNKTCDCLGSEKSGDGVLPSLGWKGSLGERNRVKWKLKVVFGRRGLMKRDIKLAIEIPVSLPLQPSSKSPLIATATKPLIYKSAEGPPPELTTTMTIYPTSPTTPRSIPFRIHLQSEFLDPGDDSLRISVGLCKHTWTKGIHTTVGSDKGHDFPGIIVGSLSLERSDTKRGTIGFGDTGKDAGMVVEGAFQVEEDEVTAFGCALRLSVSMRLFIPLVTGEPRASVEGMKADKGSGHFKLKYDGRSSIRQ